MYTRNFITILKENRRTNVDTQHRVRFYGIIFSWMFIQTSYFFICLCLKKLSVFQFPLKKTLFCSFLMPIRKLFWLEATYTRWITLAGGHHIRRRGDLYRKVENSVSTLFKFVLIGSSKNATDRAHSYAMARKNHKN